MAATHTELRDTGRPAPAGARRVRNVDPNANIEVTVILKAPALPPADKMPPTMALEEIVDKYGAPLSSIRKVEATLEGYGLLIEGIGATRRSLRASGKASAMESAFQAGVEIYESETQGEFRGRAGSVKVPAEIADLVECVLGLDQRRVAKRAATIVHPGAAQAPVHASMAAVPVKPADIEKRYKFPAGDCAGQKIAIAEFGQPLTTTSFLPLAYFPEDVSAFCQQQGRQEPKISIVAVNLTPLTAAELAGLSKSEQDSVLDATGEVMMDVEIVASLCPAAEISVYFATWDQKGWVDLIERATGDKPVSLSISYALAEQSPDWELKAIHAINDALQAAAMAGVTVCVSSGDDGTYCFVKDTTAAQVEFPASSPFVLAVGGTMLSGAAEEEVVWRQSPGWRNGDGHSGATGGGVSAIFPRPSWQTIAIASINPGAIKGRVIPDVAALAGPPLYHLIFQGKTDKNGGTSASAPVWASLLARLNAKLPAAKQHRFSAPLLYKDGVGAGGCTDITVGGNQSDPKPAIGYEAQKGFDAVTGWGVPNGEKLLGLL